MATTGNQDLILNQGLIPSLWLADLTEHPSGFPCIRRKSFLNHTPQCTSSYLWLIKYSNPRSLPPHPGIHKTKYHLLLSWHCCHEEWKSTLTNMEMKIVFFFLRVEHVFFPEQPLFGRTQTLLSFLLQPNPWPWSPGSADGRENTWAHWSLCKSFWQAFLESEGSRVSAHSCCLV